MKLFGIHGAVENRSSRLESLKILEESLARVELMELFEIIQTVKSLDNSGGIVNARRIDGSTRTQSGCGESSEPGISDRAPENF